MFQGVAQLDAVAWPRQFNSDHSLEVGGTEKFYFALVRGEAASAHEIL